MGALPAPKWSAAFTAAAVLATIVLSWLVATDRIVIGVRGSWTFGPFHSPVPDAPPVPTHNEWLWAPVLGGVLDAALLALAWRRMRARPNSSAKAGWLCAILGAGLVSLTGLILVSRYSAREPAVVAWSEWAGGFFNDARRLRGEKDVGARFPSLRPHLSSHGVTHPPGPVMLFALPMEWFEAHPDAAHEVRKLAQDLDADIADLGMRNCDYPGSLPAPPVQKDSEWAALLVVAWLTVWGSLLAAIPTYALGRVIGADEPTALAGAAAFVLVPALGFFAPWLDLLNPLFAATAACCAAKAISSSRTWSMRGWWFLAGIVLGVGLLLCYAHLAVLPFLGLWAIIEAPRRRNGLVRPVVLATIWGAAGVLLVYFYVWFFMGYNPIEDFASQHLTRLYSGAAGGEVARAYWPWRWGNASEFLSLMGWPIAMGMLLGIGIGIKRLVRKKATLADTLAVGYFLGLLVLGVKLEGGETGRLLILLMPFACLIAMKAWPGGVLARATVLLALAGQGLAFKLLLTTNNIVN